MSRKDKILDKSETICEEIKIFTGLDVRVVGNGLIELDTIAGRIKYSPSEKTIMGDVYRFISHYGVKLYHWGLDNKIKEAETPDS